MNARIYSFLKFEATLAEAMAKDTELILRSIVLENGLTITIYDKCKQIAGDRHFVKISCVVEGCFSEESCAPLLTEEQLTAFNAKYPQGKLTYQFDKERNFIDEGVKDEVLQELVSQCEATYDYISATQFSQNLLSKTVEGFIQEFQVRQEMDLVEKTQEVEEPDDFSACFK